MAEHKLEALRILRDALDTEPGERASYVSMRCGGDTALRDRVDALLRGIAAEEMASVGDDGGVDLPVHASDDPFTGRLLGPFRVLERVGRGGMGVVYRGMREGADFEQQVAIKLIRRGFDFDDIRARFIRERRILARLSHANLARFIDGGVADDGRPWFALEFVRGETITRWCDTHRLGVHARVRLLLEVCAAVQYAHTQLVVHRDLKPGNVLVDETGTVRLLDFGVAGLLATDADGDDLPSTIGARQAFTPEYAAPEQLAGEVVGVAADVYALGVILYELIAGVLPHASDRRTGGGAARAREQTPQPLVTAVPALRSLVRGDFSRIVEKALAVEPARRYATVAALSDDLESWLRGAPVRATGSSRGYRFVRFVARHRTAVAASIIAVALAAGFGAYHVRTLGRELARTQEQRNRAEGSLAFMNKLLASPDPQFGVGTETRLGDFLRSSAVTIASARDLDPEVRDELGVTIASSLKAIDRYDEALAIAQPIAQAAADTPAGWKTRVAAATLVGETLTLKGSYPEALAQLARARELADAHGIDDPLTIATLLSTQSIAHNHLGEWEMSGRLIDRAVEIARPIGDHDPEFVANLIGFASIPRAYSKTDLPKAESLLRESLAFQESHGLASTGLYSNTLGELAQAIIDQDRFEDAEPLILEAAAQMKQRFGENHRETSFKLSDVALLYFRWNRFDEARRWRDDSLRAMRAALGDQHPFVALGLIQSADLAFYAGDLRRAAADSASAVPIADPADRENFSARASLYAAAQRCDQGHADAADALLQKVTDLHEKFGVRAFDVRLAAANCLDRLGRPVEAWAAVEPFARRLADGEPLRRSEYIQAWIQRVKARDDR